MCASCTRDSPRHQGGSCACCSAGGWRAPGAVLTPRGHGCRWLQVLWNAHARRIITTRGYLKDICSLLQTEKYAFRFGVASICRLMSLETEAALEMGQLGVIPHLAQLVLKCATTSTVWPVAAAALCNMAREPMLRRIILRAGITLERNLVGRKPAAPAEEDGSAPADAPAATEDGGSAPPADPDAAAADAGASSATVSHQAVMAAAVAEEAAAQQPDGAGEAGFADLPGVTQGGQARSRRRGEPAPPAAPDSPDDEWVISYKGGFAVADKPVMR